MPKTEKQKESQKKYMQSGRIKRVPLDMKTEFYLSTKQAAEAAGESVNGFIKRAIMETAENDKRKRDQA